MYIVEIVGLLCRFDILKSNINVSSRMFITVFIRELSSGTWLGQFQRFGKRYLFIEIQIITGFDRIRGI